MTPEVTISNGLLRIGNDSTRLARSDLEGFHGQAAPAPGRRRSFSMHRCAVHQFRGCQDASCRPPTSGGTGGSLPSNEIGQLTPTQRERYDASGLPHTDAMREAIHGGRDLTGMVDATDETRKALTVPPAWRYAMVAEDPIKGGANGLLMTGIDAAGRIQNRYTEAKTAEQARLKFERNVRLAKHTKDLDEALARDALDDPAAAVTLLIRQTGMRVGSASDTRAEQEAFGASTLEARHVTVNKDSVRFQFTGKKGVPIDLTVQDANLVTLMSAWKQGKSRRDRLFDVSDSAVNTYFKKHTSDEFKIKDLRTLKANTVAFQTIAKMKPPKSPSAFRKLRQQVGVAVSKVLGNNPSEALKSYINPAQFNAWENGVAVA